MSKIEVYWVKMFGEELDAVMGLLNGKQVVLIYNDSVQSGSNIYGDLASVEETLDCMNQVIALYKKRPRINPHLPALKLPRELGYTLIKS